MKRRRDRSLAGRRVLITGASSGIGLACARELSSAGARVALLSRGGPGLREAARSLESEAVVVEADVGDVSALEAAFRDAASGLGGLDAVVANAGSAAYGPFARMSPEDYGRTIATTMVGAVNAAHVALPYLERTHGTLLFVGSIAGRVPVPWLAAYAGAKHGVRGFARSLRVELRATKSPVSIALVAPGPVDTPFWRRSRTVDGRLPPKLAGVYAPESVASEVLRGLNDPRTERTVGLMMAAWAFLDALAPNVMVRGMGPLAKLGWRRRDKRPPSPPPDGLAKPAVSAEVEGDLPSRPSAAAALRDRALPGDD